MAPALDALGMTATSYLSYTTQSTIDGLMNENPFMKWMIPLIFTDNLIPSSILA